MSDHTHEPSTRNRYEAVRNALTEFRSATSEEGKNDADRYRLALEMADKLEELIAPSVGDSAGAIIADLAYTLGGTPQTSAYQAMFEAGVQYAHERCTSGDRPIRYEKD